MGIQKIHASVEVQPATTAAGVYQKQQVDPLITSAKDRGQHTGQQASSTISDFTTAVNALVNAAITALVGDAPAALNTLGEISDALNDDANATATLVGLINVQKGRIDTLESAGTAPLQLSVPALSGSAVQLTHGKNRRVIVQVTEVSTGQVVYPVVTGNGVGNTVSLDFGTTTAAAGAYIAQVI